MSLKIKALIASFTIAAIFIIFWFLPSEPKQITQGLKQFVADHKYEPFAIPRNNWGAGTVISFDEDGSENIIWRNNECLSFTNQDNITSGSIPDIDSSDISLASSKYMLSSDATIELGLGKTISPELKLEAALSDNRIKSIEISINGPTESTVSDGRIKQRIKDLSITGNTCVDDIFAEDVYVIDRILALDGFSYSFKTSSKSNIALDIKLMKKIQLAPDLYKGFKGKYSLYSQEYRMVGYRLFKLHIEGGLVEGNLITTRVDVSKAKQLAKS
jgi:hypothetical protein